MESSSLVRNATLLLALVAAAGSVRLSAQEAQQPGAAQNGGCFECHAKATDPMEFPGAVKVQVLVEKPAFLASAHGKLECLACHVGLDPLEHTSADRPQYAEYRQKLAANCVPCHSNAAEHASVAGRSEHRVGNALHKADAKKDGKQAPLCIDCHAPHSMLRGDEGVLMTTKSCANCHDKTYAAFAASVHGNGVTKDRGDAPACIDCHKGHEGTGKEFASDRVRLGQPCMNCHGDEPMMQRHKLSTNVVSTYVNDFHGMNVKFYGEQGKKVGMPTLVCADCHGIHDVAKADKSNTRLLKENLQKVCQKCHQEASATFPDAWLSHYEPNLQNAPLVFAVKLGYWVFIPFVIIGLSLQIFAHVVLFPRIQRRRAKQGLVAHAEHHDDRRQVVRFGLRARLEHLFVMLTFILLLLTGLPQKFHESGWAIAMTQLFGGIDWMRTIHRVTGVVFSVLCVVHLAVALFGVVTRRVPMSLIPDQSDFRGAIQNLKYYIGLADKAPKFGRYDYRQKFEYWGMVIGSGVMIVSGLVLFFPILFAQYLPGQFIPAAKVAHTYEAMMALLTIIIWHMYGAHLNPDCFPMDTSIFTGKISMARMLHEHALELEQEHGKLQIVDGPAKAGSVVDDDAPPEPAS